MSTSPAASPPQPVPPHLRVGLLMFDNMELLDYAGPYEVFTTAQRMTGRMATPPAFGFDVISLAAGTAPVRARAGVQMLPDHAIGDHPPLDVLIVPGGVVDAVRTDAAVLDWVRRTSTQVRVLASVCTGAFVLADAGLLPAGTRCTTHWEDLDDLRRAHPALDVIGHLRWVPATGPDGQRLWTSAGIAAGIDLSLHLVAELAGPDLARRTARQMDYPWNEDPGA